MPSSDLILNVKQIAGYPDGGQAQASDSILIQRGGLGGPYYSLSAAELVSTALEGGAFNMDVGGAIAASAVNAATSTIGNLTTTLFSSPYATIGAVTATVVDINGQSAATENFVCAAIANLVSSFNGRTGAVGLWIDDIVNAGGAPIWSPRFIGCPCADTPDACSNSNQLATTAFVQRNSVIYLDNMLRTQPFVFTFNGRSGNVVLTQADIVNAGGDDVFDSPVFTGVPTAPTAPFGTDTTQLATTEFVQDAIAGSTLWAPINSPEFTGYPSGPTAAPGSATGQLATTAFVTDAVQAATSGVASFNTRTGAVILTGADISAAGGALLNSPILTGTPQAPTASPGNSSTQIASTAFVEAAIAAGTTGVVSFNTRTGAVILLAADITGAGGALLDSPALTGVPTAPTATPGNSSTQLATTAFVQAALALGVVSFNGRTGAVTFTPADLSAVGGATLASPAFSGTPTAPTATPGSNSTQLATTAFVTAALAGAGVSSFNSRTGAVVLTLADVTGVGGAPLLSPAFSGVPTAPTAAPGVSTGQLATTAFVTAAVSGGVGVSSFNTRTGAVVLTSADLTAAGGALVASPALTGVPTAPTATAGTNTTQLATCAFVEAALAAGAVVSFNGRSGAVTLTGADISAAGGALVASPAFTGAPTAPTAALNTNTGQLATTAFVQAALGQAGGVSSFNGRAGAVTLLAADVTGVVTIPVASTTTPLMNGTAAVGTSGAFARGDHVHPTDTSRAAASALANYLPLAGGSLSGNLTIASPAALIVSNAGSAILFNSNSQFYSDTTIFAVGLSGLGAADWRTTFTRSSGQRTWYDYQSVIMTLTAGGSLGISGTLSQGSDARGKRDIEDASVGLAEIRQMSPKHYRRVHGAPPADHPGWKPEDRRELGFVAQEVQTVLPDAVTETQGTLAIAFMPLIAALTNAVKELDARLHTIETRPAT